MFSHLLEEARLYERQAEANNNRFGVMWECPNFFPLDGKHVLIVSVMDMLPKGLEFHGGNNALCLVGDLDEETMTFPKTAVLQIDRTFSGTRRAILNQAQCRIDTDVTDLNLRILLDRYSAEVFIEDGRKVMTATMYTIESADRITFHADGAVKIDVTKYELGRSRKSQH